MKNLYLLFYLFATFLSHSPLGRGRYAVYGLVGYFALCGAAHTLHGQCPAAGAVVITELGAQPGTLNGISEPNHEYVELYNTTNAAIDLSGWILSDESGSSPYTIAAGNGTVIIPAGGFLVFAFNATSFNTAFAPVSADHSYGSSVMTMASCNDGVQIKCGSTVISELYYSGSNCPASGQTVSTTSVPVAVAAGGIITSTNYTLGPPTPGSAGSTLLPVEFTTFNASPAPGGVLLDWQTATESNNKGFFVQRSTDGQRWQDLGFVAGHGDSHTTRDYAYLDEKPHTGTNYYRLLQVDHDGQTAYSAIAQVAFGAAASGGARLFPVPADTRLTLALDQTYTSPLTAFVFQTTGQLVATHTIAAEQQQIDMDVAHLPAGSYWVKIVGDQVVLPTLRWTK